MLAAATILGSGGFVPTGRRETSSLLLRGAGTGATPVVVDAGTGLRRLVTDRERWLGDARRLDILLSHFHIDHVCGLAYLTELADVEVVIHGPGAALYETPTAEILARMFFSPPLMPVTLDVLGVRVEELAPGEVRAGGLDVRARRQDHHPNPTLGFRIGDELAWCTDTEADPGTAAFARGARVLAHDAWGPPAAPGHSTPEEAGALARDAGAERLVLIHVPPRADEDDLRARAATAHDHVTVARDELDLLAL
ncbi:MAG TPA: MBL fold metallo-hydrolase [Baekduia sp.]|uniref:MBL fold metallo-hydrolase n=1 Tax=Baekduia sp. TaxID=2600305 RepID=UPI002D77AB6F|nr:MBL fold metallo-hydrolase [Baekduia sp.]HET6509421.1 MBL fold metallo-hydrolase [Baekduia sp.]